jgi:regulator of sigma E protease
VQIAGRDATERPVALEDPRAFPNRPLLLRLLPTLIVPFVFSCAAGVLMSGSNVVWGVSAPSDVATISSTIEGGPAQLAGLRPGDEILAVDQQTVTITEVPKRIAASEGRPIDLTIRRGGATSTVRVTPAVTNGTARVGVALDVGEELKQVGLVEALMRGLRFPVDYDLYILHGFADIFEGKRKAKFSGLIGIVKVVHAQSSAPRTAVRILVILCCYLGLFTLFPLPPWSGYRALLILAGWRARRRKVSGDDGRGGTDLGVVAVKGRSPRWWTPLFNLALAEAVASVPRIAGDTSGMMLGIAGASIGIVVVLSLPGVRRWFGQACPACHQLGVRAVWSMRRARCCVRCGATFKCARSGDA